MKKTILSMFTILFVFITVGFTSTTEETVAKETTTENVILNVSDFCDGWEDGYCEGWRDVKGQYAVCPVTPVCPVAEVGKNTYKGGYNTGFKAGRKAAR